MGYLKLKAAAFVKRMNYIKNKKGNLQENITLAWQFWVRRANAIVAQLKLQRLKTSVFAS